MKKVRTKLGVAVLCLSALTACSSSGGTSATASGNSTSDSSPPKYGNCSVTGKFGEVDLKTMKSGVLTVGAVLPLPGYFNGVSPDTIKDGFEYCLAASIAYRGGIREVTVKNVSFPTIIAGQMNGVDMVMSGINITDARKKVVDFSVPYFEANSAVLTRTSSPVAESNLKSAKIGVLQGTVDYDFVVGTIKPDKSPSVFGALPELYTALQAGQIDAVITDLPSALSTAKQSQGVVTVVAQFNSGGPQGIVFPKGSGLVQPIDQVLKELLEGDQVKGLISQYLTPELGRDPTSVPYWTE